MHVLQQSFDEKLSYIQDSEFQKKVISRIVLVGPAALMIAL